MVSTLPILMQKPVRKDVNSEMEADRTNDAFIQTVRSIVLEVLKGQATLKEIDGVYSYEVAPIPGDRLSEKEMRRIKSADVPEEVLLAIIGGKYFDMLSASEQGLYQYCVNKVRDSIPSAEQAEIIDALASVIRVDPPIHYYMEQLGSS